MRHGHGHGHGRIWTPGGAGGAPASAWADDFGGTAGDTIATAPIGAGWTLNDHYADNNAGAPAHDEREQVNGRIRLRIQNNAGNSGNGKSLIWRTGGVDYYGAIHYKVLTAPFSVALYGCRVASQGDPSSFVAAMVSGSEYAFIGMAARNPDAIQGPYEHCVIGYRGGIETLEWKRRDESTGVAQGDVGAFASNQPVGSVRLDVAGDGTRTWYYSESVSPSSWTLVSTAWGSLTAPTLMNGSNEVAVGFCAYAFDNFVPDAGYYIDRAVDLAA